MPETPTQRQALLSMLSEGRRMELEQKSLAAKRRAGLVGVRGGGGDTRF